MATGTSPSLPIGGEDFTQLKDLRLSPVDGEGVSVLPPEPVGTMPSEAMTRFQNQFRDFAFQKISPPVYGVPGSLPEKTGLPGNEPDFIADFHFISLMRIIDQMLYYGKDPKSYIGGDFNTPNAE